MKMTQEQKAKMLAGRKAAKSKAGQPILCSNGLYLCIRLTKKQAISAFCTECMGFEGSPKETCTSWACPLYPFRAKTLTTREGNLTKEQAKALHHETLRLSA